jgi:hypothetical protein
VGQGLTKTCLRAHLWHPSAGEKLHWPGFGSPMNLNKVKLDSDRGRLEHEEKNDVGELDE